MSKEGLEILKKFKENFKKVIDKYNKEDPNFLLNTMGIKIKRKESSVACKKNVI